MADTAETMAAILGNLRKKYHHMNQLMEQTKQLDMAAKMNDAVSFEMALDMRWKTMIVVDKLDAENREQLNQLPELEQMQVRRLMRPRGETLEPEGEQQTDIYNVQRQILSVVEKVITLDDEIRKRTGNSLAKK